MVKITLTNDGHIVSEDIIEDADEWDDKCKEVISNYVIYDNDKIHIEFL